MHKYLGIFLIMSGSALTAQAAVNLAATETSLAVRPGETFSVTLYLDITDAEKVTGFDFYWEIDPSGSGLFELIGRDSTGSSFDFLMAGSLPASGSAANLLDPRNDTDLGAGFSDIGDVATTGSWLIARYTFSVSPSIAGSFVLSTASDPGSGWVADASDGFNSHAFGQHASISIHVTPIPEPAVFILAMALGAFFAAHRCRRFGRNSPSIT